jgi:NADH dehydrogenase FAD-containing subunit
LGGGFAGAYAARELEKRLRGAPGVEVVLVARENFVLFTPMLHEVAGGDVAVTDIVQPLRKMLRHTAWRSRTSRRSISRRSGCASGTPDRRGRSRSRTTTSCWRSAP